MFRAGAEETVRAHRALGAPLFFVIEQTDISIWQVFAEGSPRLLDRSLPGALPNLFESHRQDWNPDAIHRAKSIGRFNDVYQLDFVDVGLMPAIEGQVHEKLDRLLREALGAIQGHEGRKIEDKLLFRGIFRLLAAKILTDRSHEIARRWEGKGVFMVLKGIGDYYGLEGRDFDSAAVADQLSNAWKVLSSGINVANISADDLAFVYENTLVTPETRRSFGTHSTPRHVAEYIVGRLELWQDAQNLPNVFEPFAGAGVFLVSALRHLRESMPHDWSDRQRHDMLVRRISGAEIDAFACEVATLSLILADYPNRNGWKIENADLFGNGALAKRLEKSDVVLCNPPFEIFTPEERTKYRELAIISGAKAEAVLALAVQARPKALGFVLPRTFLMDRAYHTQRREIEKLYREVELVSLPDGVFSFSQVESALLIAKGYIGQGERQVIRASEVDDKDKQEFALTGRPTRQREEARLQVGDGNGHLWITPLAPIWRQLNGYLQLRNVVDGHWGLRWRDGGQREAELSGPGTDRVRGLMTSRKFRQFAVGRPKWLDYRQDHIYGGANYAWSEAKLLCNAARLGRGYWRLAAAVDRVGLYASQQFIGLWPLPGIESVDLDALAAVLNGPVANAFMADHSSEKRFRIETLLSIPIPHELPAAVGQLAREYAAHVAKKDIMVDRDMELSRLLDQIDIMVLGAYDLSPRLERDLLCAFRRGERPLVHDWQPWAVAESDPALKLSELRAGLLQNAQGNWPSAALPPVPREEAAKASLFLP